MFTRYVILDEIIWWESENGGTGFFGAMPRENVPRKFLWSPVDRRLPRETNISGEKGSALWSRRVPAESETHYGLLWPGRPNQVPGGIRELDKTNKVSRGGAGGDGLNREREQK